MNGDNGLTVALIDIDPTSGTIIRGRILQPFHSVAEADKQAPALAIKAGLNPSAVGVFRGRHLVPETELVQKRLRAICRNPSRASHHPVHPTAQAFA